MKESGQTVALCVALSLVREQGSPRGKGSAASGAIFLANLAYVHKICIVVELTLDVVVCWQRFAKMAKYDVSGFLIEELVS